MGRQRRYARQHLFVCSAAFLFLISGCPHHPPDTQPQARRAQAVRSAPQRRWDHLQPVQPEIAKRDFEAAARQYHAMLDLPGYPCADLALFDLGLLASHYANPHKDYHKAAGLFSRLVREHPRSPLVEEARIWVTLLETLEQTQRVDIELEEKKRALGQ